MKLATGKLALAVMLAWAGWYTLCALLLAIAPAETQAAFSYALHYDMPSNRPISFFSYLGGLVSSTVWVGLFIGSIGWAFNRLGRSGPAELGMPQPAAQT
jgi:hypothetical protein